MDYNESFDEIEEGEFIVERIISHKFINGKCYYLIKWQDFDDRDNTWEEESSLDCPNLLEEYQDLNIERIEQDRIISQEIEKKKKEKKRKDFSLFKNVINNNLTQSHVELLDDKEINPAKPIFKSEKEKIISQTSSLNKDFQLNENMVNEILSNNTRLSDICSLEASIPKIPKCNHSNLLTIIGNKTDINGQLLFCIATNDGKIVEIPKKQLFNDNAMLYLKYLEESIILKSI